MLMKFILWLALYLASFGVAAESEILWRFNESSVQTVRKFEQSANLPQQRGVKFTLNLSAGKVEQLKAGDKVEIFVPLFASALKLDIKETALSGTVFVIKASNQDTRLVFTTDGKHSFATVFTARGAWSIRGVGNEAVMYQTEEPAHKHNSSAPDYLLSPDQKNKKMPSAATGLPQSDVDSDTLAEVDAYIIYNQAVTEVYGDGTLARISHIVAVTNDIYEASNVHIRLNALRVDQVEYSQEYDSSTALRHATGDPDYAGFLENERAVRDAIGADVMIFFRPYVDDGVCGIAWLNSGFPDNSYMVSHTSIDCGDEVNAHELGHNMGLAHSRKQGDTGATYPFALGYGVDGNFTTIMAYPSEFSDAARIYKFSSPDLDCNDLPCGIDRNDEENGADAAYALNQKRFEIAAVAERQSAFGSLRVDSLGAEAVSVASESGHAGVTSYSYSDIELGSEVVLEAPAIAAELDFHHWQGCTFVNEQRCTVIIQGDMSVTAVYSAGLGGFGDVLDAPDLSFGTSGDAQWQVDYDNFSAGSSSLRSGSVLEGQVSSLDTVLSGAGQFSFDWKVSSEAEFDFLIFYVNDVEFARISGESDWSAYQVNLADGNHVLRWDYIKDGSVSSGHDAGWIDNVVWSAVAPQRKLSVVKSGEGRGTIMTMPTSIVCDELCDSLDVYFAEDTMVTVEYRVAEDSVFNGWSGACSGVGTCIVQLNQDKDVAAEFLLKRYPITAVAGVGGRIIEAPTEVVHGQSLTFVMQPDKGFKLERKVTGDCPAGIWLDRHTYQIPAATAGCSISFSFVEVTRRRLPLWLFLPTQN